MGKGRQLAGLILENILAGRTKHIWVTTNIDLKEDAQRDLRDVGATIAADLEADDESPRARRRANDDDKAVVDVFALPHSSGTKLEREGVIKVFCIIWIDGEGKKIAAVLAIYDIIRAHNIGYVLDLLLYRWGESWIKVVFVEDGFELGIGLVRSSEYFDDLTFRVEVSLFPFKHFNYDLIAHFRCGFETRIFWIGHEDVMNDTRIIRDYIAGMFSLFEGARDGDMGALEYTDNSDVGFLVGLIFGSLLMAFASKGTALIIDFAGQHGIAVH